MSSYESERSPCNFRHAPLDHDQNSIRLMKITAVGNDGQIHCTIIHTTTDYPHYTCLSYCWGSPDATENIFIDGKTYTVRRNLHSYLQCIGRFEPDRDYYWIDALCIDQDNPEERNHQVRLMGSIYSSAARVIAWLGPVPDNMKLALRWLGCLFFQGTYDTGMVQLYLPHNIYLAQGDHCSKYDGEDASDFVDFVSKNEYWGRAWITQEIILSKKVLLRLNNYLIEYKDLLQALCRFPSFSIEDPMGRFRRFRLEIPLQLGGLSKHDVIKARGTPLLSLLGYFGHRNCAVPRDSVYSLLWMSSEAKAISVDYQLPSYTVLVEVLSKNLSGALCVCTVSLLWRTLHLDWLEEIVRTRNLRFRSGDADIGPHLDVLVSHNGAIEQSQEERYMFGHRYFMWKFSLTKANALDHSEDCPAISRLIKKLCETYAVYQPIDAQSGDGSIFATLKYHHFSFELYERQNILGAGIQPGSQRRLKGISMKNISRTQLKVRFAFWALAAMEGDFNHYCRKLPWGSTPTQMSSYKSEFSVSHGHWDLWHDGAEGGKSSEDTESEEYNDSEEDETTKGDELESNISHSVTAHDSNDDYVLV